MKRGLAAAALVLLMVGGMIFVGLYTAEMLPSRIPTLLRAAGLPEDLRVTVQAHDYWNDPLLYTDGYEIALLRVEERSFDACLTAMDADSRWQKIPPTAYTALPDVALPLFDRRGEFHLGADDVLTAMYNTTDGALLLHRIHHTYGI